METAIGPYPLLRDVSVIFFDAVGTLIFLPRGVGYHYAEVARRHGATLEPAATEEAFKIAWNTMPPRAATRGPRPDDDRGWWRVLVNRVLEHVGAPPHFDRVKYFEELYQEFARPGVWGLFPEVPEVLEALEQKATLAVLSNFDARLRPILADLAVLGRFRHVVISSEVGADKPDPPIFHRALELAGAAPHEALLVGNDPVRDGKGAEAVGMRAWLVDRPAWSLKCLLD